MEQVLTKLKNLYKGEEVLKRHCYLLLLFILPSIIGSMRYVIDRDAPKEILLPALCILGILLVLYIVPYILTLGFSADFYRGRIKGEVGLPAINAETFGKGFKVFGWSFVWGIYAIILSCITFFIPAGLLIFAMSTADKSQMLLWIILGVIGIILLYLLTLIIFVVLTPFVTYIYLSFVEDFEFRAEYFNPMLIISHIKAVFKPTMITMLKFLLATIIVSTVVSTITTVIIICVSILSINIGMSTGAQIEQAAYTPAALMVMMPIVTICTLAASYTGGIMGFALGDAYVDIYKKHIRIPDPLDDKEENHEVPKPPQNDGWVE